MALAITPAANHSPFGLHYAGKQIVAGFPSPGFRRRPKITWRISWTSTNSSSSTPPQRSTVGYPERR